MYYLIYSSCFFLIMLLLTLKFRYIFGFIDLCFLLSKWFSWYILPYLMCSFHRHQGNTFKKCYITFIFLSGGNIWHLIVEACIARILVYSSTQFYLGYVGELVSLLPQSNLVQVSPWAACMESYALTVSLRNVLIATPSLKYFQVLLRGIFN